VVDTDEGPAKFNADKLRKLRPVFKPPEGASATVTAGNASPVTDGAAALVLASYEAATSVRTQLLYAAWCMKRLALHGLYCLLPVTGTPSITLVTLVTGHWSHWSLELPVSHWSHWSLVTLVTGTPSIHKRLRYSVGHANPVTCGHTGHSLCERSSCPDVHRRWGFLSKLSSGLRQMQIR
jgi:hypothetical protein